VLERPLEALVAREVHVIGNFLGGDHGLTLHHRGHGGHGG
jgi:hypothetical protein